MAIFFEEECLFRGIPYRLQVHGNFSDPTFVISPLSDRPIKGLSNALCDHLTKDLPLHPHNDQGDAHPDAGARVGNIKWFEQKANGNFDEVFFRVYGKNDHGPGVYWGEYKREEYTRDELAARVGEKEPSRLDPPTKMNNTEVEDAIKETQAWSNLNGPSIDRSLMQRMHPKP